MHGTTARRVTPIPGAPLALVAVLVVLLVVLRPFDVGAAGPAGQAEPSEPPTTANDFFPEQRDVTDCIGVLERPGCGSESRGGWRQVLVFGLIAGGLVVVFTKITIGVRRGRSPDAGPDAGPDDGPDDGEPPAA